MKIFVVTADTVTDVSGEVFSEGFVLGAYAAEGEAYEAIKAEGENYARKSTDYTITECVLGVRTSNI
jgi:hypothetical protein